MPTTISIVTPSYQQAGFLRSTMLSVLEQGYPALEYLVIDGGSTDGSAAVIASYEDSLAYWVSEPDKGHAEAVNKGFQRSSGEIMGWLNSSDVYYPWTLQTVADVFDSVPGVMWISGTPSHWSEGSGPKGLSSNRLNRYDFAGGNFRWLQQESMFWRRELWDAAGGRVDGSYPHAFDIDLWMRFFERTELHYVDTILAGYRYHDDRRGAAPAYEEQALSAWNAHVARTDGSTRRRGMYARMMSASRAGRAMREAVRRSSALSWDTIGVIRFDHDTGTWRKET